MDAKAISEALQDRKLDVVSERTGIPYNTLLALRNGKVANPHQKTLAALRDYFTATP